MKLIDAELILMKGDAATEAEVTECARYFRQQLRSDVRRIKTLAGSLKIQDDETRQRDARVVLGSLEIVIALIQYVAGRFPELADDWAEMERRANTLHQEVRATSYKAAAPALTEEEFRQSLESRLAELQAHPDRLPGDLPAVWSW